MSALMKNRRAVLNAALLVAALAFSVVGGAPTPDAPSDAPKRSVAQTHA
jgi:hypothetical protein